MKKRTGILIAATSLLLMLMGSVAFCVDWVQIYSDEDYTVSVNKAEIVQMGDRFEVAERWEYKTQAVRDRLAKASGQPPKYDITVKLYKKERPVYQIISITYYNDKGEEYYSPARDDAWRIMSPGMLGELLWQNIKKLM